MLLRRITKHVKDQNWFAIGIDFFIVVIGILIAFQITNWSEQQQANKREQLVLMQLEEEFTVIKAAIEKQNSIRKGYVTSLSQLIATLEGVEPAADDLTIKTALNAARSTGRQPAQSAAYLQLMSSGELTMLSNEILQKALVHYDTLLHRDAFVFPELMNLVAYEFSSNQFIDYNSSKITHAGAAIDKNDNGDNSNEMIRSYNLDGLQKFENRYEFMFVLHSSILNTDKRLLVLVNEILNHISNQGKL